MSKTKRPHPPARPSLGQRITFESLLLHGFRVEERESYDGYFRVIRYIATGNRLTAVPDPADDGWLISVGEDKDVALCFLSLESDLTRLLHTLGDCDEGGPDA